MPIHQLSIEGAYLIEAIVATDDRGWFAKVVAPSEFEAAGLDWRFREVSLSFNRRRHTLRGLHLQRHPHEETKLVRCIRGSIFDVLADVREDSATYGRWTSTVLTADDLVSVYVPPGVAHGFLTLEDDAMVEYMITPDYVATHASGVRWNDPSLAIEWPARPVVLSERDAGLPLL